MKINKTNSPIKRNLLIVALLFIVAVLCYGAYAKMAGLWPFREEQTSQAGVADTNIVDYSGPTEEDVANSQNAKEKLLEEGDNSDSNNEPSAESTSPPNTTSKKSVTVNISYADIINNNLEVRAFTSSVIQGTGQCTIIAKKTGASTITKTTPAFVDVSSTICEPVYIPRSQLSTGTWIVTATYSSPTHSGSSGTYNVEVK